MSSSVDTAPREAVRHRCPAGHVAGNLQQDGGDGGHGDQSGVRHEEYEHGEQYHGVDHAGSRRTAATPYVGRHPRDGTRRGDGARERRADVANALRHQLHISAVMARNHGIGNHTREQRLDGSQKRNGKTVGQLAAQQVDAELRDVKRGQAGVDGIEVADRVDVEMEYGNHGGAGNDGDKRSRDAARDLGPSDKDGEAHDTDKQGLPN